MASIQIKITEADVKSFIVDMVAEQFNIQLKPSDIVLLVKSSQNYKAEWEIGQLKFEITKSL